MSANRHTLAITALLFTAVQASASVRDHDTLKALTTNPVLAVESAPEPGSDDEEPGISSAFRHAVIFVGIPFVAITAIAGMWLLFTRSRIDTKSEGTDRTAGAGQSDK
jgi:hypothetical protein